MSTRNAQVNSADPMTSSMPKFLLILVSILGIGLAAPSFAQTAKRGNATSAPLPPPAPPNPFAGLWLDHTGDGVVEIGPCGPEAADKLCGRIVWLRDPNDRATGRPLVDALNEEPAQRVRPICGLPVLGSLVAKSDGTYDDGWIYDPRQGKAFKVELTLLAGDRLQVMGYKGIKLLNRKFVWIRATEPPNRCPLPARS